jgi:hypothetical protein
MKTFFICSAKRIQNHVGEEYDSILEVEDQPTTVTIGDWANRIMGRIRALWHEQKQANDLDPKVVCHLDGASAYHGILANLQIRMKAEEGIITELPYVAGVPMEVTDKETVELLEKLDGGKR